MLVSRAPDLWTVDHTLVTGGLPMGGRTTVLRAGDGRLVVVSPGALTPEDVAAIRVLGPVSAVIAPNLLHHLFLEAALAAFPEAEGWAAPGVAAKHPGARLSGLFDGRDGPWAGLLTHHLGGMPKLEETVVLHPASRTLVLTDLCFNLRNVPGWFGRTMLTMLDAYGRFGPSWLCRNVYTSDRAALRRSLDAVLEWDFDRVIVTHGDVVETGGKDGLREAFARLAPARSPKAAVA